MPRLIDLETLQMYENNRLYTFFAEKNENRLILAMPILCLFSQQSDNGALCNSDFDFSVSSESWLLVSIIFLLLLQ